MIVRILGEGQFDVADTELEHLNELDAVVEAAIRDGDEESFGPALDALLAAVREVGTAHEADALDPSDLILPMADATLDEVRAMLATDGLIPG